MDNSDAGSLEKREGVEVAKQNVNEGIQKSSGKKLKNETDKGKQLIMQSFWHSLLVNLKRENMLYMCEGGTSYVLGRSDLKKTFVAAGHYLFLSVLVSPLSLALLKGLCAICILLMLIVGFCVLTVNKRVIGDHTDACELVLQ